MARFFFLRAGVFVALAAAHEAVAASKASAQCGPSLLQVSAVRRQVTQEQPVQGAALTSLALEPKTRTPPSPTVTPHYGLGDDVPANHTGTTATSLVPDGWLMRHWYGHQFLLELAALVALMILLAAGILYWAGYGTVEDGASSRSMGLGERSRAGLARMSTALGSDLGSASRSSRPTHSVRFVAWGENVQSENCDYVMVFSSSVKASPKAKTMHRMGTRTLGHITDYVGVDTQRIVNGFEMARKAFLEPHRHHFVSEAGLRERFKEDMTLEAYRGAACEFLHTMFTSAQFGFTVQQFANVDKHRLFWRLELNEAAVAQYAAHYRYPVSLDEAAYAKAGHPVPKDVNGEPVYAFWAYMPKWAGMYKPLTQTDRLKLMRMRIERYVNMEVLLEQNVLLQHFAVHDLEDIGELVQTWGNLTRWWHFPSYARMDQVKDYFGEQVGFMFMWQRFYLSALLVPAIVGGAVFFRRFCLPVRVHSTVQMVFTVVMSVWATIFIARYQRFEARTRQRWGMEEHGSKSVQLDVQAGYDPTLQGSWRLTFVYGFGDFSAFCMMILSVLCTFLIQRVRTHHLDYFGNEHEWYVEKGTALATSLQILIMDSIWQFISYEIVSRENHRLRSSWWDSWIKRILTVRFFTNLYPFVFVGFLKEYSPEGCPKSGRGCLDELQTNLFIFFSLSLFCNIARDIGLILYARMNHALEFRGHRSEPIEHMSIQVQATLYDYNDWVFIDDWTRQVTTFLLLTCFNVVLPVIGVFVLLTTMFEARLLAHRICCHLQRPFPQGAQGIGTWQSVLEIMTLTGVLMTVSFAIFVMKPLRERPLWDKFILFVFSEHAILLLNLFVRSKFPSTPPDVHEVSEQNEKMLMQHFIDPTLHSIHITTGGTESLGDRLKRVVQEAARAPPVVTEASHTAHHPYVRFAEDEPALPAQSGVASAASKSSSEPFQT